MIDRANKLIAELQGYSRPMVNVEREYVLQVLKWLVNEVSQYAQVSDAMRQAGWLHCPNCDTSYTKIYQVMRAAEARAEEPTL